eukprot:1265137-Alexandrium_andersonii.AAC.1
MRSLVVGVSSSDSFSAQAVEMSGALNKFTEPCNQRGAWQCKCKGAAAQESWLSTVAGDMPKHEANRAEQG